MSNEVVLYEEPQGIQLQSPERELEGAEKAAAALRDRVFKAVPPAKIQGRQYPLVEHWQTIASFYGVVVKVSSTQFVQYGDAIGWEATAEAIRASDGMVLSRAEAMCMSDEPRWQGRPHHQMRAMAQTRAISRALRNIFARVMVLAGVEPTPAEDDFADEPRPRRVRQEPETPQQQTGTISEKQQKLFWARVREAGLGHEQVKELLAKHGWNSTSEIPKAKFDEVLAEVG
jgi:hypothetical protein